MMQTASKLHTATFTLSGFDKLGKRYGNLPLEALNNAGLSVEDINTKRHIDYLSAVFAIEEAVRLSNDELFPYFLALENNIMDIGGLAELAESCSTLGEAIEVMFDLYRINSVSHVWLIIKDDEYCYLTRVKSSLVTEEDTPPSITLHGITLLLKIIEALVGQSISLHRVGICNNRMDNYRELERKVNCKVKYCCRNAFVCFDKKLLDLPLPKAHFNTKSILHSKTKIQAPNENIIDYTETTKALISILLPFSDVKFNTISQHLNLHPKRLQRILNKSGTNFQTILNNERLQMAKRLLIGSGLSLSQISLEVGFSDLAVFSHFINKNLGMSPRSWRKLHTNKVDMS